MEAASGEPHDVDKALVWSVCALMFFLATAKTLGTARQLKERVNAGGELIPKDIELSLKFRDLLQV